ncbi:hypothetical protein [Micromonospora sp. WMMD1219]|uniref:hypothetical protein n=1 Tax=Micromonospora sp. WMMD1219 TaxID=3404115 RepID=UPI003BF5E0F6
MAKRVDYKATAADYLRSAERRNDELGVKLDADDLRRYGAAYAALAVAQELGELRDAVSGVESALKDNDNIGAGDHLKYISDWLNKISRK